MLNGLGGGVDLPSCSVRPLFDGERRGGTDGVAHSLDHGKLFGELNRAKGAGERDQRCPKRRTSRQFTTAQYMPASVSHTASVYPSPPQWPPPQRYSLAHRAFSTPFRPGRTQQKPTGQRIRRAWNGGDISIVSCRAAFDVSLGPGGVSRLSQTFPSPTGRRGAGIGHCWGHAPPACATVCQTVLSVYKWGRSQK
jgi:hypothetical protein